MSSSIFLFRISFLSKVSPITHLISQSYLSFCYPSSVLFRFAGLSFHRSHLTIFCLLPFSFLGSPSFRRYLLLHISSLNLFSPFVIVLQLSFHSQVSPFAGLISQSCHSFHFHFSFLFPFAGISYYTSHLTIFCLLSVSFSSCLSIRRSLSLQVSSHSLLSSFNFLFRLSFSSKVSPVTHLISQSYLSFHFPLPVLFRFAGLSFHRSHFTIISLPSFSLSDSLSFRRSLPSQVSSHNLVTLLVFVLRICSVLQVSSHNLVPSFVFF